MGAVTERERCTDPWHQCRLAGGCPSCGALALAPSDILQLLGEAATLLRELQWSGHIYTDVACCPYCNQEAPHEVGSDGDHDPGCRLANLLHKLEGT